MTASASAPAQRSSVIAPYGGTLVDLMVVEADRWAGAEALAVMAAWKDRAILPDRQRIAMGNKKRGPQPPCNLL